MNGSMETKQRKADGKKREKDIGPYINIWYNDTSKIVAKDRCRFRIDIWAATSWRE